MSSKASLDALQKTRDAIREIQKQLRPFLVELGADSPVAQDAVLTNINTTETASQLKISNKQTAVKASMAVALAMGTLRYMGARLRGLDQGRKADDPLRKELNDMRRLMVTLQKKLDETSSAKHNNKEPAKRKQPVETTETKESASSSTKEPAAKRKKST